jgi:hypothetical protein
MSNPHKNPFENPENLTPMFESSKRYQVQKSKSLNNFLKTQSFSKSNNNPSIFNTLFTMTQSLTHISRLGFASLALFTIIGGGLTAQAFAPEGFKPTDVIAPEKQLELQSVDCNEFISVKLNTDMSFEKNGIYMGEGSTIYIQSNAYKEKIDNGTNSEEDTINASKSFIVRCYPNDGSISWEEIEKYHLKETKKGIRYWLGNYYCTNFEHKGVMWIEQYGCVNETKIEKVEKTNFSYLPPNSLSKIDDDKFYIRDEDAGFQEQKNIYQGIQYYIATKDKKFIQIQISDSEFFKNKVQIEIK